MSCRVFDVPFQFFMHCKLSVCLSLLRSFWNRKGLSKSEKFFLSKSGRIGAIGGG